MHSYETRQIVIYCRGANGPNRCFNAPHMWQLGWSDPIDVNVSDLTPGQYGCGPAANIQILLLPFQTASRDRFLIHIREMDSIEFYRIYILMRLLPVSNIILPQGSG